MRHLLVLLVVLGATACGGSDVDADCDTVCQKNVECRPGGATKDACVAECRELAKNEDYADALSHQAECYAEAQCQDIVNGQCAGAGTN